MKQNFWKWTCAAAAVTFFACSSESSSTAPAEELSSAAQSQESSSSFTENPSVESSNSSVENPEKDDPSDNENADTDTLSTSTWLTWDVPAPKSGTYTAPDSAVMVSLQDENISVTNAGTKSVSVSGNQLLIGSGGLYVLSGNLSDGQILINVIKTAKVELVLNGVQIHNSKNAPIFFVEGDKVKLELVEGSVNVLSDSRHYEFMNVGTYTEADSVPKACLYSREDMTIGGNGTLYVTGNYNNGIHTKADLVIKDSPKIYVNAVNNALKGKGSVRIKEGGEYYLRTGDGSGISSDKVGNLEKGRIAIGTGKFKMDVGNAGVKATNLDSIGNGTFEIRTKNGDAFHAETVQIFEGDYSIESGDEAFNASKNLMLVNGSAEITKSSKPFIGSENFTISEGRWFGLGGGFDSTMIPKSAEIFTAVLNLSEEVKKGAEVSIQNEEGTVILTATAEKNIQSIFAATSEFSAGQYKVVIDSQTLCSFTFDASNKIATQCVN